jgi:D-alanyl-D-alanine carboxypeptidase
MASTAKIVTSLAALDLLGPRWRWRTQAFATGPLHDGQLLGDLLIVGGGDPRLTTAELRQWLAAAAQPGPAVVRGDLVVDRSAFHLQPHDHAGTPRAGAQPAAPRPARCAGAGRRRAGNTGRAQAVALLWREAGGRLWGRRA